MSYQPHLHKGGELYHFRTKGSKNGVSNTPGYKAVGKKALGFLNSAGQYVYDNASKAAGSAGNWLSDRGKQVSKAASNAYNSVSGKNYRDARAKQSYHAYRKNWASDDLGDPISGYQQNERAKRATSANKKAKNLSAENSKYVQAVRSNRITANESKALGREDAQRVGSRMNANAGRAATAKKNAENAMQKSYNLGAEYRDWVQGNADKMRAHAGQEAKAKREADNSLYGKLDKAGKWVSGTASNIRKNVSKAANNVSKAANNASEFVTGNSASKKLDNERKYYRSKISGEGVSLYPGYNDNRRRQQEIGDQRIAAQRRLDAAESEYNKTLPGRIAKAGENISKAADSARKAAGDWLNDRGEDISNTAKKAGNAISKTASDAKKTASKVVSGAGKAAGRAAKSVGNFASTSFESAKKTVGEGANRAGEFIFGLFGKKKSNKSRKPTRGQK